MALVYNSMYLFVRRFIVQKKSSYLLFPLFMQRDIPHGRLAGLPRQQNRSFKQRHSKLESRYIAATLSSFEVNILSIHTKPLSPNECVLWGVAKQCQVSSLSCYFVLTFWVTEEIIAVLAANWLPLRLLIRRAKEFLLSMLTQTHLIIHF